MNTSIINVPKILNNAPTLFSAGFSEGYSFDVVNAADYFEDLFESSTHISPIFSGILIMEKAFSGYLVVDGIQRLTTISLLLSALCENYKNTSAKNDEAKNKIFNRYLVNGDASKLKLFGEEEEIYRKIVFSENLTSKEMENNLFLVHKCFLDKIKSKKISGTTLFKIISKIQFMVVLIEKSEVSTSDLYQSLNKDKLESQVNLVSSFINYEDKNAYVLWHQAIESYKRLGLKKELGSFLKAFLTVQSNQPPINKNAIYNNFKSYFILISKFQDTERIIKTLSKYAEYYLKIITEDFDNPEIKQQISQINNNNGEDSYSYLMEVLDDLENEHINTDVFIDILIMINSFIDARQKNPLSGVTIDFASLSKEINKMLTLDNYAPQIMDENKLTINEINNLSTFEV